MRLPAAALLLVACSRLVAAQEPAPQPGKLTVLRAAHLLDVAAGKLITPGEVLVEGPRIREAGARVAHPAGAAILDLGSATLMPGLIDAHTHLFLHPGAEDLQTVQESVPQRTLIAADAAKLDLMAGFTSERDMGSEGAGCADAAVKNAINSGLVPGPRMRVACNAVDVLGGHEDAIGYNPAQHVLSNADVANNAAELVAVIREQRKGGADFTKIYETGKDSYTAGSSFSTPFQYTQAELAAAVAEADRTGSRVAVHATAEPGTGYAARAGVASVDHAYQLSPETMQVMQARHIYAVPTFTILEYFAAHAGSPAAAQRLRDQQAFHAAQFKKQIAAGVPFAVGSDVGPFPHGTQAREYELMAEYGMKPADVLRSGLINGARLLDWADSIGQLKAGFFADIIAVPGDPLADISVLKRVSFVMKNGEVVRTENNLEPRR